MRPLQPRLRFAWFTALSLFVAASIALGACGGGGGSAQPQSSPTAAEEDGGVTPLPQSTIPPVSGQPTLTGSGLQIIDIEVGTGNEANAGDIVYIKYTWWLADGTLIDDVQQPLRVALREGNVVQGWVEGIAGMRVGGKRRLIVPPELGYGTEGEGNTIPPSATLTYDIELTEVREAP